MALNSAIEWTESTWNPTTGCTKVSPGCKNCHHTAWATGTEMIGEFALEMKKAWPRLI